MGDGGRGHSKLWYLSRINLFADMTPPEMAELARITRMEEATRYQAIYLPGDAADAIYLLKQGRVRISKLSPEGKQVSLVILEPGDIFGEMALVDEGAPRDTIAEALEDTVLCLVRKEDFEALLRRHPKVNLRVTKFIGWRLRRVESKIEDMVFRSVPARLAHLLLQLAADYGRPDGTGTLIGARFTHQDLAELINASRQTVTELLNRFQAEGIIHAAGRRLIVRDRARLRDLADHGLAGSKPR